MRYNPFDDGHANRGMSLEEDINITNEYYLSKDIGVIYLFTRIIIIH